MGKKGKWFSSVKKALSPEFMEKKEQTANKSKKKWFGKQKQLDSNSTILGNVAEPASFPSRAEEVILVETTNVPDATAATAEPALPAVEATTEVVQLAVANKSAGKSREEVAAISIQTAFRGYLARRALQGLRGRVRLKSLMEGPTVKQQAARTLWSMQILARVQSQIHSRRIRMSEENQALQGQLLQKLQIGEEWDDSLQSKEQVEANLLHKYEAAMRRERALAYSFSRQQTLKNSSRSANPMFTNPGNPTWGWSWLERWMAAHPWDSRSMTEKEISNDQTSTKSGSQSIVGGEISRSYARYQLNSENLSPRESEKHSHTKSPRTPFTASNPAPSSAARKLKSASPRSSIGGPEDDFRSMASVRSERYRRHSIGGSLVLDDESLGNSPAVPSYMVPTESARVKSRFRSPLGEEKNQTPEKEKGPSGAAKKRLSYSRPRWHSGQPKVESNFKAENIVANGEGI